MHCNRNQLICVPFSPENSTAILGPLVSMDNFRNSSRNFCTFQPGTLNFIVSFHFKLTTFVIDIDVDADNTFSLIE